MRRFLVSRRESRLRCSYRIFRLGQLQLATRLRQSAPTINQNLIKIIRKLVACANVSARCCTNATGCSRSLQSSGKRKEKNSKWNRKTWKKKTPTKPPKQNCKRQPDDDFPFSNVFASVCVYISLGPQPSVGQKIRRQLTTAATTTQQQQHRHNSNNFSFRFSRGACQNKKKQPNCKTGQRLW